MAARVFFSFDDRADAERARQVRNSWIVQRDRESAGIFDSSLRALAAQRGDRVVKQVIVEGLQGAAVTAVLIGSDTAAQRWVRREIDLSLAGKRLLGIHVHRLQDARGQTAARGPNPFTDLSWWHAGRSISLAHVPVYDWVLDDGPSNLAHWVSVAPPATRPE